MQSLATFFEDNKPLAYAASVAAILVLIIVVFVLYRLLFGRRLRAATNGRARQPRLGIVDAYDLDRQRQLVLVRRDNVEHLIMIGGPTDVVVETSIVRMPAAAPARDKDGAGALLGTVTPPAALTSAGQSAVPAPASPSPPPMPARSEPIIAPRAEAPARAEPTLATRTEPPMTGRAEPTLAGLTPMPSPVVERPLSDRGAARPLAVPDPSAPAGPAQAEPPPQPIRPAPPRPQGLPPRPPSTAMPMPSAGPTGAGSQASAPGSPERATSPRSPLPPRPPVPRQPLPPRPSLASSLPPRPARPLPSRPEPQRPDGETSPTTESTAAGGPGPGVEPESRNARGSEPASPRLDVPAPPKTIESLESLEEEMAKLLGRPTPRRDG